MNRKIYLYTSIIFVLFFTSSSSIFADENPKGDKVFNIEYFYTAKATISETIILGKSKYGERRIIPITGGTFEGPNIKGMIMPDGADWQLVRPDGDLELNARYLIKTNDGYYIQVTNRVLIYTPSKKEAPYMRSVIDLEAPIGSPYEWVNHSIFLGTLTVPELKKGETPYVVIGVYRVK
jgi:hypothetical protein